MTTEYGRSRYNTRVYALKPTASGEMTSTVAVLTDQGIEAEYLYQGTMTAERFVLYLEMYLMMLLGSDKTIIMDNAPIHTSKRVISFLKGHRIKYLFLPPYSPELNPIEEAFSKIKQSVRRRQPRLRETLYEAIKAGIASVTENDVLGYINHSDDYLDVTLFELKTL